MPLTELAFAIVFFALWFGVVIIVQQSRFRRAKDSGVFLEEQAHDRHARTHESSAHAAHAHSFTHADSAHDAGIDAQ